MIKALVLVIMCAFGTSACCYVEPYHRHHRHRSPHYHHHKHKKHRKHKRHHKHKRRSSYSVTTV